MKLISILPFLAIVLISTLSHVCGVAVMSIDLGSEWMKIAIVSPGVPMEIILNTDSSRKTPVSVGFRDDERFIGDSALNLAARFPEKVFTHFLDLIGKTSLDDIAVKNYKANFPYHKLIQNQNGGISFVLQDNGQDIEFTPEELLSMLLSKARVYAEIASASSSKSGKRQKITDCVITVPPYFSQAERKAIKYSATLAGLKILQLMNTNTAFALNYGVFRRKDFNSTATNILFYDIGASDAVATLASYKVVSTKDRGFTEKNPQLEIKGVGFDRYLGGFQMDLKLREHLLKLFVEQSGKSYNEVLGNKRAMAKLLKEAGRLKKVLSANTEHKAQVENVMNDMDFKSVVSRETFETIAGDMLSKRVLAPLEDLFKNSGFTMGEIDSFIIVGGGTRIPKIQKALENYFGRELSKNLNADEAGALGAAYQAAFLSKGFKVKTFHVKDYNMYSISVDFPKKSDEERIISRVIFGTGNSYPQKKVITFSKHKQDFDITVNYNDVVPQDTQKIISKISLKDIQTAYEKYSTNSSVVSKGIKVHFRMDESGLFNLENSEVLFEFEYEESKDDKLDKLSEAVGDAISKLGDTLSGFFKGENATENDATNDTQNANENSESTKADTQKPAEDSKAEEKVSEKQPDPGTGGQIPEPKKELKKMMLKENLQSDSQSFDYKELSQEAVKQSLDKLKLLDEKEESKLKRDSAINALESFISETRDKFEQEAYQEASTDEQKETIPKELSQASEWLEYESDGADYTVFEERLKSLKTLTKELFVRVKEHQERPEALSALRNLLNITEIFYGNTINVTEEDRVFTDVELNALRKLIDDTQEWMVTGEVEQASLPKSENPPKLTLRNIGEKMQTLDREVKYLLNKARLAPPKKKDVKKENEKDSQKPAEDAKTEEKAEENNSNENENNQEKSDDIPVDWMPETSPPSDDEISPDPVSDSPQKTEL